MRFVLSVLLLIVIDATAQLVPLPDPDSIKSYIAFLGDDKLQGRGTGSPGLQQAAEYISAKLNFYGLKPKGQNNNWFQKVPMHGTKVLPSSTLQIYFNNHNEYLFYAKDFLLIKSAGELYKPGLLPVVFVGFGINAPDYAYNDYDGIDVSGKIVIFMDGEPDSDDPDFFEGQEETIYSLAESKIRTAISFGAAGSIIIHEPSDKNSWAKKRREYAFEEVTLPGRVTGHLSIYLNSEKADIMLQGSGLTYSQLLKQKTKNNFTPVELKTKVAFNGDFKRREFKSNNVIAVHQGRDALLKDKYILIGAHYDHLGVGEPVDGDSIYNGVMDNAVGCAVTLELARMFATADFKPKRSLVFVFFTGEEKGLLGSDYYVSHPQVDLDKTTAMINIDGLSAMGRFRSLMGVGGEYSELGYKLKMVANEYGLEIEELNPSSLDLPFSKSDQISFAQAGVPAMQIIEGYLYPDISRTEVIKQTQRWFETHYHSPYDDLNQPIDYDSITRYTSFMFILINRLLNQEDDPAWLNDSPYQRKHLSQ